MVIVAGPTCSGKSALALDLAAEFGGSVVNADSMQIYRELPILTARPTPADEARVPHHLYGVLSVTEECSAARWRAMAVTAIEEVRRAGRLPILCGGTGLYLKAMTEGLSPIPDVPAAVRAAVRDRFEGADAMAIHAALHTVDPAMAGRLPPSDRQRLLRALEVFEATGRSLAEWHAEPAEGPPAGYAFHTILVTPPRAALYADCDARFLAMLDSGALEEIRRLRGMNLAPDRPAMKALGVADLLAFLDGRKELEAAVAAAQQATRNYAKRQMTWFRRQIVADLTINEKYSEKLTPKIFSFIFGKGLTRPG